MRFLLIAGLLLTFHYSVLAQEVTLKKDVSCYVILEAEPFLTRQFGKLNVSKFQLFDICNNLSAKEREEYSKIEIERNGKKEMVVFGVDKEFINGKEAKEFAERYGITNTPFKENADCRIIRNIKLPLSKKTDVPKSNEIVLLNTCLDDEVTQQRPTMKVIRNGKKSFRTFEVWKSFDTQAEAEKYAEENCIIDVDFR